MTPGYLPVRGTDLWRVILLPCGIGFPQPARPSVKILSLVTQESTGLKSMRTCLSKGCFLTPDYAKELRRRMPFAISAESRFLRKIIAWKSARWQPVRGRSTWFSSKSPYFDKNEVPMVHGFMQNWGILGKSGALLHPDL